MGDEMRINLKHPATIAAFILLVATILAALNFGADIARHVMMWGMFWSLGFSVGTREAEKMRDRLLRGDCMYCGYDLTGNVSGTCPECGRVMVK